ncbi:filamentous hemagglutinin N-terminal domain-containing protein [Stenotrophomonas sp. STM01]|uniref:MBG domain-containing protein n=1 Tax=Stenotrophomonas sp. STM01 TaxID=2769278 RepID=UPI0017826C8E|nr:MBG domain-containing protein [Stenotrophomonas sp. STM01]MBD9535481.1 filamentous hemagglutinin N-terminal domain-containing protein [Stenotrophomonas sp. STM01]
MNRIYRLVFNSALRQVQVASEAASGGRIVARGRRTQALDRPRLKPLALALALAWAGGAQAQVLPSNPVVVQGTVSIANTPNTLQVTQTGNRALINWSNFSIGQSDAVNFITNNPSAVTLNVVIGNLASQIDGMLNSDGHVFLINPNGITFGGNAHVNVAGLLATTLSLQDPNAPIYDFRRGAHPGAAVLNHGQINANGGPVLLAGAAVGNYGTIQGGHIGLVAADRMVASYDPAAGMSYHIVDAVDDAPLGPGPVLVNTGTLQASQVNLLARVPTGSSAIALNMGGVIVADTLVANAGGGALAVGANIQATQTSLISDGSLQQTGGTIDANTLALQTGGGASLNTSGNTISFIEGSVGTSLVLGNNRALSQLGALSVGGDATFNNGPHAITLSNANNTFSGGVRLEGGTTTIASNGVLKLRAAEVQSLTASAIGIELNGFFNSTGDQAYNGDVTLTGNASLSSSAGNIAFNGSVNGGGNLRVDAKDEVRFGGIVGGAARLGSVEVVSGDAILNGSVYTWGMQRYADAVRLGGSVSLSSSLGSDIVFGSTIDGAYNLLVQTDGTTRFGGTVGGSSALATLRQDGGTFELGANVNTIGLQTYEKVKLVGDVNVASLGGGDIRFDGAVNGGHALATSTTGQTYFTGSVGGLDALTSLTAGGGGVTLLGGNVTTTGNQHYLDAAVLVGNSTLTSTGSGTIQFSKRLDGNFNLAVNTAGQSIFDGTVGFYTPLLSFSSDLPGSTRIDTQFRSVGGIVFNDMLELSANTVVTSTTGSVRFGNMISGGGWDLRVGGATGTRFDNDVQANMLTVEGNGTTTLAGDVTVADAAQFNRPVLLAGDVAVSGQSVVFGGSIDGGHALDITAAAVNVAGHIGGSTPLASLAVDAGTLALSGTVTTSGALSLTSTGSLLQAGAFQVGGPASFSAGVDITLSNAGNSFAGKVALHGEDVTLHGSSGLDMDGVQAETLVATAGGRLDLSNAVVNGDATLTGGGLGFAQVQVGGNLVADSAAAITQSGSLQVSGTSTLDAGGDITLRNAGNVFTGAMDVDGEAVAITAGGGLNISALQSGTNKAVELVAGGQLSVAPAINTGNASLRLSSLGGALAIANALSGGQVSLNGASGLTLAADVTGAQLSLSSQGGSIMQTAGSLLAAGTTTLYAGNAINLGMIGNSFGGDVSVNAGDVLLRTGQSLSLADVTANRLEALAGTGLTVSNADTTGDATLDGGSGQLLLRGVTTGGGLTAKGTSIGQGSTLYVHGDSSFLAGGDVLLTNAGNFFGGVMDINASNAHIISGGELVLGEVTASTLAARADTGLRLIGHVVADNVDLATAGIFDNRTGADAIRLSGNGRWNIYLDSPHQAHAFNNLDSGNTAVWNTAAFGNSSATGNRYVFAWQPTLTVAGNTLRKTYGDVLNPLLAFRMQGAMTAVAGAYKGDELASLFSGLPSVISFGAAANANASASPYVVTVGPGTLDASASGYQLAYTPGQLFVDPRGLIITAGNASKTYGQASSLGGYSVDGLVNGDTVSGLDLFSNGSAATANAGNYVITAGNASGTGLGNYAITYVDGLLSVGKATLTITAGPGSKTYGQDGGFGNYSVDGLLNSDAVASVMLGSDGAAANASVGHYAIHAGDARGTGLGNYTITYVDGQMSVGKANLVITAHDASKRMGQALLLDGYTVEGLLNGDRVEGLDLSSDGSAANAEPGRYAILASAARGDRMANYAISYQEGTLDVSGIASEVQARIAREIAANAARPGSRAPTEPAVDAPLYRAIGEGIARPGDACVHMGDIRCLSHQPE